jgi:signal transduction histidine kinase
VRGAEAVAERPDGTRVTFIPFPTPLRDASGRLTGAVNVLVDITERKRAQAAAEDAIRQSMAVKEQFLGLVSHELRTPLATILGNALLLLRRGDMLDAVSKEQALSDVAGEAEKLQRIIENLLLLTRIDAGQQWEAEPVRLLPLIEESVATFRRRTPEREVVVKVDGGIPAVMGREAVIGLVLHNLISNADKYSPPDKPIEVVAGRNGDQGVDVCVRDYGVGLDEDETEEIFTPFYRPARIRDSAQGIGLGLAVCKRVIEAQGGSIRAVSRPEGGCDFIFALKQVNETAT